MKQPQLLNQQFQQFQQSIKKKNVKGNIKPVVNLNISFITCFI